MPPSFRIPAPAEDVLAAVGRAVYNFSYLEWKVIWAIAWLRNDTAPINQLAKADGGSIAREFAEAVEECAPSDLASELSEWADEFSDCVRLRNDLLHAHPDTADAATRTQGLWRVRRTGESFSVGVTADEIHDIARRFDEASSVRGSVFDRLRPRSSTDP